MSPQKSITELPEEGNCVSTQNYPYKDNGGEVCVGGIVDIV